MLLKSFKTPESFYVYSAWNNEIARVPPQVHDFFSQAGPMASGPGSPDAEWRKTAVRLGLLPEHDISLSVFPQSRILGGIRELQKSGPSVLVLTITEQCNFRCSYCTYSGGYEHSRSHSGKSMPLDLALKAVDWYGSFEREDHHIGFYGGEPLLHFDLMARTVEHARNGLGNGGRVTFGLTTNGALLTERIADFLADQQFETHISIDGPAEIHDRYRVDTKSQKTFDRVWKNICSLKERHPKYFAESVGFTMTIVPEDPLTQIQSFIQANKHIFDGKIPKVSPLSEEDPGIYDHLGIEAGRRSVDYGPAALSFIEDSIAGRIPDGFSRGCMEAAMRRIHFREMHEIDHFETHGGQCVPGVRCHVDPDGVLHMCEHMAHHFPIGTLSEGFDTERIEEVLTQYGRLVEKTCGSCWALRLCKKCFANLARGPELSEERMSEFCGKKLQKLESCLVQYCAARERNDHCFDWLPERSHDPGNY